MLGGGATANAQDCSNSHNLFMQYMDSANQNLLNSGMTTDDIEKCSDSEQSLEDLRVALEIARACMPSMAIRLKPMIRSAHNEVVRNCN
tara:strand:- start:254 stop:520 length:267 start_codon:yes stop_codon:yes gene_type:complete